MSNTWFRLYDEVVDDPKVQRLPERLFKAWINFMCIASKNSQQRGTLPDMDDIAYRLHLTKNRAEALLQELVTANLFEWENGICRAHNWNGRQFQSDTSRERTRNWRERHSDGDGDVTVTAAVTDHSRADTDTDTEKPPSPLSGVELLSRYTPDFERFWQEYPRKAGKDAAFKAWQKRRFSQRTQELVLEAIQRAKRSQDWLKDSGQFIPHPSTWLNEGRWNDELEAPAVRARAAGVQL